MFREATFLTFKIKTTYSYLLFQITYLAPLNSNFFPPHKLFNEEKLLRGKHEKEMVSTLPLRRLLDHLSLTSIEICKQIWSLEFLNELMNVQISVKVRYFLFIALYWNFQNMLITSCQPGSLNNKFNRKKIPLLKIKFKHTVKMCFFKKTLPHKTVKHKL